MKKLPDNLLDLGIARYETEHHRGDPERFFGYGFVAFVDLLGFSRDVLKSWSNTTMSPVHKLIAIKEAILSKERAQVGEYYVGDDDKPYLRYSYRPRVWTTSDSMVLGMALPNEATLEEFTLAIHSIFINIGDLLDAAATQGYVCRGAVEAGEIFWSEQEIVGPAFNAAYEIESRIARFSRILVGPGLLSEISSGLATVTDYVSPRGLLMSSAGGYVALKPRCERAKEKLDQLKQLRDAAPDDRRKAKYDELVSVLRSPADRYPPPSNERCAASAKKLSEELRAYKHRGWRGRSWYTVDPPR